MENELKDTSQALACGHVPLSVKGVHTILKGMLQSSKNKEGDDDSKISNDLVRAVQLGATLWDSEEAEPDFFGRVAAQPVGAVDKTSYQPPPALATENLTTKVPDIVTEAPSGRSMPHCAREVLPKHGDNFRHVLSNLRSLPRLINGGS